MAKRTVTTVLKLDKEKEYQSKIKSINGTLRTLRSELSEVTSRFTGNANSMDALKNKSKVYNAQLTELNKKLNVSKDAHKAALDEQKKYAEKIEKSSKALDDLNKSEKKNAEEKKKLEDELKNAQIGYDDATKSVKTWQSRINYAQSDINKLNTKIDKNNQYIGEAEKSTDKCAKSIDGYGKTVKNAGDESKKFGDKSSDALKTLAAALAAAGVKKSIEEIYQALKDCTEASKEFEDNFTGVTKTVDGTDEELAQIRVGIQELSTDIPATTKELSKVAETAGQLDVQAKNVLSFTDTMTDLGVATNLTAEEAAKMLAQFANITRLDASKYENLGSVIVDLGNNFATDERKITEMSKRMASAATVAGFAETDIMALSTAVSSLGIESEAGGSAMGKLISKVQVAVETGEGLNSFADVANMSANDFSKLWGENAVGALNAFVTGLNDTERNGKTATVVLKDMGLTEIRMRNAVLALANSKGLLTRAVNTANKAWEENNALQAEAEKKYANTKSQSQLYENSINNLRIAIGDRLNPSLNELKQSGIGVSEWAQDVIKKYPWLVNAITGLTTAVGLFTASLTVMAVVSIPKVAAAIKALWLAITTNPIGLLITAVAAATAGIIVFTKSMIDAEAATNKQTQKTKKLAEESDELVESIKQSKKTFDDNIAAMDEQNYKTDAMISKLEKLMSVENKTSAEKSTILSLVEALNKAVPNLSLAYDEETDSLNKNIIAVKEYAKAKAVQSRLQTVTEKSLEDEYNLKEIADKKKEIEKQISSVEGDLNDFMDTNTMIDSIKYRIQLKGLKNDLEDLEEEEKGLVKSKKDLADETAYLNDEYNKLNSTLGTTEENTENVTKAYETAATAIENATDKIDESNSVLERSGDAVIGALKNKASKILENSKAAAKKLLETEKEKAKERLDVVTKEVNDVIAQYQKEYDEKRALLDEEYKQRTGPLQQELDKINSEQAAADAEVEKKRHMEKVIALDAEIDELKENKASKHEINKKQAELDKLVSDRERTLRKKEIKEQLEHFKTQYDNQVKANNEALEEQINSEKDKLKQAKIDYDEQLREAQTHYDNQLKAAQKHYDQRVKQENLLAKARKLILADSSEDLVKLLTSYSDDWDYAGQTLSDAMINGIKSRESLIKEELEKLAESVNYMQRKAYDLNNDDVVDTKDYGVAMNALANPTLSKTEKKKYSEMLKEIEAILREDDLLNQASESAKSFAADFGNKQYRTHTQDEYYSSGKQKVEIADKTVNKMANKVGDAVTNNMKHMAVKLDDDKVGKFVDNRVGRMLTE